jgi:hypothetical protein
MLKKIDYRKELPQWYRPSPKEAVPVELPPLNYLMIDGAGDPNTAPDYAAAVEALFTVSYTIKFMVKRGKLAVDYGVMPLEGLWWTDDMAKFSTANKERWKWTMMIMQPPLVTGTMVGAALAEVKRKKNPAALGRLRFESFAEGRCGQIMHLGPFADEGPTVEKLHQAIAAWGGKLSGKHHEIYLSDIRKAAPAKWKTVIRQPFC